MSEERGVRRFLRPKSGSLVPTCWGVLGLLVLTYYYTSTQNSFELFKFNSWLLFAIGAIALNVLMGTAGQVSIGNSAFLAVGAFGVIWIETELGIMWPFDVILAGLLAGVVGIIVGLPAIRLRGLYLSLATLAAFFIVTFFANQYQSDQAGSAGFFLDPLWQNKTLEETQKIWAWILVGVVGVVLVFAKRIMSERSGRSWRLVREHESVALAMGVNVTRRKLVAFTLSSVLIGIEGGLLAHFSGSVTVENFTILVSVQYLAAILIGGLDSNVGSLIGAAVIAWLPFVVPDLVSHFMSADQAAQKGPQISQIVYGALIIAFIIGSPDGIVGIGRKLMRSRPVRWARDRVFGNPAPEPALPAVVAGDVAAHTEPADEPVGAVAPAAEPAGEPDAVPGP